MIKRHLVFFTLLLIIIIQGCAYSVPQIRTPKGVVNVGMNKQEVLSILGKPYHKWFPNQSVDSDEWLYPGPHWWGANQMTIWFNEEGLVKEIEFLQD